MNKKGFELSINFLVTLILAIVLFIFGFQFFMNLMDNVSDIRDKTFDYFNKKVEDIQCDHSQKTCIGTQTKIIRRGKFDVFSLSISNIMNDPGSSDNSFEITITPGDGYDTQHNPLSNEIVCLPNCGPRAEIINKNDRATIGIGIQVPDGTPTPIQGGMYPFTVDITVNGGTDYDKQQFFVEVP